ncbi:class I SAM-dependent methyltransferase [bacterium]|nr:class I SAM-dependent methyltransferase [bacterium]
MNTKQLFLDSSDNSSKWEKYFEVYDHIFGKFKNKKITFVEVGIANGGSLHIWKNFFHPDSRIIGIDFNPECKKFEKNGVEIFIGDQSDQKFWESFYKKVGKIDILLDDGGHTNSQQIMTAVKSIPNINDNGILMVEDTHSSYMPQYSNPNKYSFINFTKKIVDDVNFKHPWLTQFKFSLNDYVYSIQYFESMVVFYINTKKTFFNKKIKNKSLDKDNIEDFRYHNSIVKNVLNIKDKFAYFKKFKFLKFIYTFIIKIVLYLKNTKDSNKNRRFFK